MRGDISNGLSSVLAEVIKAMVSQVFGRADKDEVWQHGGS